MSTHVLLADPDETLLDSYRDFLTRDGFEVETASSGPDCLMKLRKWRPDVLVLEAEMPNDWGERILAGVRGHPDFFGMPVIILSRHDYQAFQTPVREFHVKPIAMADLAKSIRTMARERQVSSRIPIAEK